MKWRISKAVANSHLGYRAIVSDQAEVIVPPVKIKDEHAALIAAAPEMYAVLRKMHSDAKKSGGPYDLARMMHHHMETVQQLFRRLKDEGVT